MYLVLLDHSFMSTEEFQALIEQYDETADIVHSSSADTLLNIAEKLLPEIIIIDFIMIKDQGTAYFEALSEISKEAYVLVLLDPEYYEKLNVVIEIGGIDGYIAKPIRKEEFMARIQIANRRNSSAEEEKEEQVLASEEEIAEDIVMQDDETDLDKDNAPEEQLKEPPIVTQPVSTVPDQSKFESLVPDQAERDETEQDLDQPTIEIEIETAINDHEAAVDEVIDDGRIITDLTSNIDEIFFSNLKNREEQEMKEANDLTATLDQDEIVEQDKIFEQEDVKPGSTESLFSDVIFDDEDTGPTGAEDRPSAAEKVKDEDMQTDLRITADNYEKLQREIDEAVVKPAMEFLDQPQEVAIKSSLPGKSADEFLYGENLLSEETYQVPLADEFTRVENDMLKTRSRSRKKKKRDGFLKVLSVFGSLLLILVLMVMAIISFFLIQSQETGSVPELAGYQLYVITTGDMSPEIADGSLAYGRDLIAEQVLVGDIIAFRSPSDPKLLLASRVIGVEREDKLMLTTRGDANSFNDPYPIPGENIIGRVTGSLPYAGYLFDFAQTREGLILLIFIPGGLIIAIQLLKIARYLFGKKKKQPAEA